MELMLKQYTSLIRLGFEWVDGVAYYIYKKPYKSIWTIAMKISDGQFTLRQYNKRHQIGKGEHKNIVLMYELVEDYDAIKELEQLIDTLTERGVAEAVFY